MLAVNPIPRRLGAGGFMNSRMVERMAAIGSQWFLSLPSSSLSLRASAVCDKSSRITATQDSLAAALVTQLALRLDRLDATQCLRGIDDAEAGMIAN